MEAFHFAHLLELAYSAGINLKVWYAMFPADTAYPELAKSKDSEKNRAEEIACTYSASQVSVCLRTCCAMSAMQT